MIGGNSVTTRPHSYSKFKLFDDDKQEVNSVLPTLLIVVSNFVNFYVIKPKKNFIVK